MKKNLLLFFAMTFISWNVAHAALPDGSTAEDWTLTDLNSNVHNLYSYLNAGVPAILDFSATWCNPCWNYHNNGPLKTLYNTYGPSGTNEMMVFHIEADGSTNTDCLYGLGSCVGGTAGNWVAGTPYPIIDLIGADLSVRTDYNITYFPTLYGVSLDARTWEVGQASQFVWESWMLESFQLDATGVVNDALCGDNGSIDMTPSGGAGSISYNWSNGDTGPNITDLNEGIYMVTISDANGYFIEKEFTVGGPSSGQGIGLEIVSITDVDCNGNANGVAHVEGTFGNYGYSYDWSNGDSGPVAYNLFAGDHTVSITDAANCTEEFIVTVNEPEVLFSYPIESGDACGNGTGEVFFVPLGGTAPYYFDIGNGPEPTDAFFDLPAGTYDYIHTDANNCSFTGTFEIELVGIPTAVAMAASDLDCTNTSVTVSGNGSSTGGDYDYLWTTTNGNITSDPTLLDITVDEPGDYNLEITHTNYGCVESASAAVAETVSPPNSDAGQPSTVSCNVPQVSLDGTASDSGPDYTYQWTTTDGNIVDGADGLTPTVDAVGTYTLAVTNTTNGCVATSDVVIPGDFTQPAITTSDAEINCSSTMVEICATVDPSVTVKWTTPNGEVTANCIMVSAAGSYTATATGSNGCTNTASSTVTQSSDIPQTEIETPAMITCDVQEVQLTGTLVGDLSEHTVSWTTSNGNIVSGENTLTPTVDQGGAYVMSVTNNTNGCSSQVTTTVEADVSLPMAAFSFEANIGMITLTNASTNNEGDVTWDLGNGETAEGNDVVATYEETGIYTICVTANNECGPSTHCEDIQFVTVMTFEGNTVDVNCYGNSNGQISVTPNGGLAPYTILWEGPNGFTSDELELSGLEPGEYTMTLSDDGGNMSTESFLISEPTELVMTASPTDVSCFGGSDGSISVSNSGGTAPYTTALEDGGNPDNLPAGEYTLITTDDNNCEVQLEISIDQPNELAISSSEVTDADGGQSNGAITVVPEGGTGQIEVSWDNGMTGASITGLEAGFYTPTLTDENNCSITLDPIEVKSISNIADLDFVNSFLLSPNPASNIVNIEVDLNKITSSMITIQNTIGQNVYQQEYLNTDSINSRIDVNGYDSGMYILTLTSGNSHATHKFIVVK